MPESGWAAKYRKAIKWALAAFCILWVGWYFYRNRQDLRLFLSLRPSTILILLVLFTLHLWLYSLQFYLVLRQCAQRPLPFVAFLKTIILGRFLSSIAPQAGAVWRAVYLKHKFGISYTRYLSGFFCFLWIDAAMNILLSAAVFGYCAPTFHVGRLSIWWILLTMTVVWFMPIVFESLFGGYSFRTGWLLWLHGRFSELLGIAVQNLLKGRMLIRVGAINLLNFANNILIFHLCLSGSVGFVTLPVLVIFFILLKLSSYIILTPGNIGVRELAYGFLSQHLGLTAGAGIVLSIFYRLFGMIIVSLFGLFFGGTRLFINPQQGLSDNNKSCVGGDDIQQT